MHLYSAYCPSPLVFLIGEQYYVCVIRLSKGFKQPTLLLSSVGCVAAKHMRQSSCKEVTCKLQQLSEQRSSGLLTHQKLL